MRSAPSKSVVPESILSAEDSAHSEEIGAPDPRRGVGGRLERSLAGNLIIVLIGAVLLSGAGAPAHPPSRRGGSVAVAMSVHPSQGARAAQKTPQLDAEVEQWREAVAEHEPGKLDAAVTRISLWPYSEMQEVIAKVTQLARLAVLRLSAMKEAQRLLGLTDDEAKSGDASRVLKRGALLHTDIALLAPSLMTWMPGSAHPGNAQGAVVVMDCRTIGTDDGAHWEFAAVLLDEVYPQPADDDMVRQWYLATIACMHSLHQFGHAMPQITRAQLIFPSDAGILFYSGVLHEAFAAPRSQNAMPPPGSHFGIGSEESELRLARQALQLAVAGDPQFAEAHLRLGRVTGLLGNHDEAVAELEQAAAALTDPRFSYYAALFLGHEQEMLGHRDAAREQFECAAHLFPTSQSPLLALSQLASRAGDAAGALLAVERIFKLPLDNSRRDDPWVDYTYAHVRSAGVLMAEMYKAFGGLPR
jgi:tetratricopeptide (TPR) repeat protein